MIRHADENDIPEINRIFAKNPDLAVRPSALLKAYGVDRSFLDFWLDTDSECVIARLENVFFLHSAGEPDYEELACFLEFNPYFSMAVGTFGLIEKTGNFIAREHGISARNFMRFDDGAPAGCRYRPVKHPDYKKIFDIISTTYDEKLDYDAWYADIRHRRRHGCARVYLINEIGGSPASVCLISSESDDAGLISGVTTLPEYRRHGYASSAVLHACADLRRDGKSALLECFDEKVSYYEKLGFEFIAKTAELTVK